MDSLRRTDSMLSISSINYETNSKEDDTESTSIKTNNMSKVLLDAASETSAENSVLGTEILELFSILKLDLKTLAPDIKDGLQKITAILKAEGLSSIDETVLKLCLEKKQIENKMKERSERLLKAKYNTAFARYIALEEKLNRIGREIKQAEDVLQTKMSNYENEESNRILWTNRIEDYKETLKKLYEELDDLQNKEIGLEQLNDRPLVLLQKLSDLDEITNKLSKYGDLPPNLLQAKNLLEIKKKEKDAVADLLFQKINN